MEYAWIGYLVATLLGWVAYHCYRNSCWYWDSQSNLGGPAWDTMKRAEHASKMKWLLWANGASAAQVLGACIGFLKPPVSAVVLIIEIIYGLTMLVVFMMYRDHWHKQQLPAKG